MRFKWVIFSLLIVVLVALPLTAGCAAQAPAGPRTLTMVGSWTPKISAAADMGIHFMEEVNRQSGGELAIEFKGASEVVPTFDQPEALVRGVFDVWFGAPNYWAGVLPAGYITELSRFDIPDNGPGSELFDFMVEMFEKKGVRYLGHYTGTSDKGNHFMYTQDKIGSIADLAGKKIRVPPLTRFVVEAIGAEPVTLPPGEVYIALERGTVDGFTWPIFDGFTNFGWQEVSKYVIHHPLYRDGIAICINLDVWNSLSKNLQEIILEAVSETQSWSHGWVAAHQVSELSRMQAAGMEVIQLSPAEATRWAETSNEALWAHFKGVMSSEDYAKARQLMGY